MIVHVLSHIMHAPVILNINQNSKHEANTTGGLKVGM